MNVASRQRGHTSTSTHKLIDPPHTPYTCCGCMLFTTHVPAVPTPHSSCRAWRPGQAVVHGTRRPAPVTSLQTHPTGCNPLPYRWLPHVFSPDTTWPHKLHANSDLDCGRSVSTTSSSSSSSRKKREDPPTSRVGAGFAQMPSVGWGPPHKPQSNASEQ